MSKARLIVLLAMSALALGGCGAAQPKRVVDPRTEALRFFPADAEAVALMRTDLRSGDQAALESAAGDLPAWIRLRAELQRQLAAAGLSLDELRPALRPANEPPSPPTLAAGAATAAELAAGRPLLVLVTDHAERLGRDFTDAAAAGNLQRAGSYHEADLYRSRSAAFAVRDGVLVAAHGFNRIRDALDIRDGDRDGHLNDGEVEQLLGDLPGNPPLEIYADPAAIADSNRTAEALSSSAPWATRFGQLAAGVHAYGPSIVVDVLAKATESADVPTPPFGEEPTHFSLDPGVVPTGGATISSMRPLLGFVNTATPLSGTASYSDGELRVRISVEP